ncbi:MAG TPA: hypothetical protein VIJ48_03015 [Acidimicrobiia bacterium]
MPRTAIAIDDDVDSPGGPFDVRLPRDFTVVTEAVLPGRAVTEVGVGESDPVAGEIPGS